MSSSVAVSAEAVEGATQRSPPFVRLRADRVAEVLAPSPQVAAIPFPVLFGDEGSSLPMPRWVSWREPHVVPPS